MARPRSTCAAVCAAIAMVMTILAAPALRAQRASGPAPPAAQGTLDRLKAGGMLRLAYRTDARPISFRDQDGRAAGFSVRLCQAIVDAVRGEPGLAGMKVDWIPVTADTRFLEFDQGQYDVLCGATTVTLARRARMSFSIPIFAGGIGAVVRADAADTLRAVLGGQAQTFQPVWEGAAAEALAGRVFAAGASTTAASWLTDRLRGAGVRADIALVPNYDAGVQALVDRKVDVVFGERAVLLDAVRRHPSVSDLHFVERFFTFEPLAIGLPRGDDELRLIADRTLSRLYRSGDVDAMYGNWFGAPDHATVDFYRAIAIPE